MELFLDALLDALIDGVKMLPFLYLAYLLIEWLERHHGESIEGALAGGGRWGFIPGALLGCVPQCGFSAVASNLYASRVITPGTLLAVFIATSDEAIPLLAAEPSQWITLVLLLACKVAGCWTSRCAAFCRTPSTAATRAMPTTSTATRNMRNQAAFLWRHCATRWKSSCSSCCSALSSVCCLRASARSPSRRRCPAWASSSRC